MPRSLLPDSRRQHVTPVADQALVADFRPDPPVDQKPKTASQASVKALLSRCPLNGLLPVSAWSQRSSGRIASAETGAGSVGFQVTPKVSAP